MAISIRFSEEETRVIKTYAKLNGTTVSDVIRRAIMEKIENEFELHLYEQAYKEYEKTKKTYTIAEAKELLDME